MHLQTGRILPCIPDFCNIYTIYVYVVDKLKMLFYYQRTKADGKSFQ